MISMFKALIPGFILTFVVSAIIGRNGSSGGVLAIQQMFVSGHYFHWSWSLFAASTLLAFTIFKMME